MCARRSKLIQSSKPCDVAQHPQQRLDMGWLRIVGSLKLDVSFAKEPYKRDDILRKKPIILRSLLIVATPYLFKMSCSLTQMSHQTSVVRGSMLQHVAACCSMLQHVAACCSMLQHVAACCSMLQRDIYSRCTAYCILSVISWISNLSRTSSSLRLLCHVPLKRDQCDSDSRSRFKKWLSKCNLGCTAYCIWSDISWISNLNRRSSSWILFWEYLPCTHVSLSHVQPLEFVVSFRESQIPIDDLVL